MTSRAVVVVALLTLLPSTATAAPYAQIEGTGDVGSELIVQQWVADVDAQGMKVYYTAGGSTKGRSDLARGATDFAISALPDTGGADSSERPYATVPLVGTGLAFPYRLERHGERVSGLRFSGSTLTRIFAGDITRWNDPAIVADNNGRRLPSTPIRTVVRSDGSPTTQALTDYFVAEHPGEWSGCGGTEATAYFPLACGGERKAGSDQMVHTMQSFGSDGTIGYVENSYAAIAGVTVAEVRNDAGWYVAPTWWGVALALRGDTEDPRSYPLSYVTSAIVPTAADDPRMTSGKRQTLVDFLSHSVCAGQYKAAPYGYAPLPLNRVQDAFAGIESAAAGDPEVDLAGRGPSTCDNPTFDRRHLDRDELGTATPMPAPCAATGAGPCGTTGPARAHRAPAIIGRVRAGSTVKADEGRWSGADSLRYRWLAGGRPVAGAHGPRLHLTGRLVGRWLKVQVTGRSADFHPTTATSSARRVQPAR